MYNGFDPEDNFSKDSILYHNMEVPLQIPYCSKVCEIHVTLRRKIVFLPITKSELGPGDAVSEDQGSIQQLPLYVYGFVENFGNLEDTVFPPLEITNLLLIKDSQSLNA